MTDTAFNTVQASGSLRKRLMITLIGGTAILALILFFIVRGYAAQIAQNGQDSILEASVSSILDAAILRDGSVEIDFPYASLSMLDTLEDDRVFYAIYQDDELLSGYATLPRPQSVTDRAAFETLVFQETPVRLASASRVLIGASERTEISVVVGQTQDALSGTLNSISRNVAAFGAGFFAIVSLLSFWATATTINPLQRLANAVKRRGPQDLRPFDKAVPVEMVPLVSSLNTLMGRLDQSLTQSEDFIAEAAHRVRTPLATVRSYAETTLVRVTKSENRAALRSMIRAIDESSRAAGQLLDHAMITFRADHLDRQKIELVALVQELVTRLEPIAQMKDVELQLTAPLPVEISGDPILIQNAVRNIIDNALKYSPSDAVIKITVDAQDRPKIQVCDQGPGFPPDEIATLTNRFARGNNAKDIVGSGLGLTIAKDVVAAHDGTLEIFNHDKGGACAVLSF